MRGLILGIFCVIFIQVVSGGRIYSRGSRYIKPKDTINQWNIVQQQQPHQNNTPGFVWVQIPVGNLALYGNTINAQIQNKNEEKTELNKVQQETNQITGQSVTSTVTATNLNSLCLKPNGQFPGTSCNKFVNCWNGVGVEQDCPQGLLFNSKGYCDYPGLVNCKHRTNNIEILIDSTINTSKGNEVRIDSDLKSYCVTPRGLYPGSSCDKYVNCWDNNVVEQQCPDGLLFSAKGYCDYPEKVDCQHKNKNISKIELTTKECPLQTGFYRDINDCSVYYKCHNYKIETTYVCPIGYKFNEITQICDVENRVNCAQNTATYHTEKKKCGVEYGTFRDEKYCNRYYTCVSYEIVAQHDCPDGYNFNDKTGICDFSYNVNCNEMPKIYQINSNTISKLPAEYRDVVSNCVPGTVFKLDSQCAMACICRSGLAEIVQCPNGYAYDVEIDKCVLYHLSRC